MKSFLLIFSILFLSQISGLKAHSFSFDNSIESWGTWGTGLGGHDPKVGHTKAGSLWLSSDWGEAQTIHYNWNNLRPGLYKVTAFVRAQDVQPHTEGSSFWHFFDSGKGTENVFLSLHGSYEWRKIEYTVNTVKNNLSIWFRLRSPGQVWIDDLSIEPVIKPIGSIIISEPTALKRNLVKSQKETKKSAEIILLDFDKNKPSHPFSTASDQSGKKMGSISSREYYNFDPSNYLKGNWSNYDRIELDVFNGNNYFVEFYLTLGDKLSVNYWSQLNHKTHLAPGWNHLNFSLTQFLGERGSHRFARPLDRSNIKKIFLVVDANQKYNPSSKYFIDNIKLSFNPSPVPPDGLYAFDFTSHKDNEVSGFQKVTSQDLYHSERGFGFSAPRFWRVEDSQWAANSLRYSIGLLDGHFKVKLPNGKYRLKLVADRLGYWDPSFWKDRTIYINEIPVFKESRPFARDFLNDLLQFETVIPNKNDHPYDLYLKKIFKPIDLSFTITNGELDMKFEGDATGISLNTLVIWHVSHEQEARKFLNDQDKRSKLEFDWMTRPIAVKSLLREKSQRTATIVDASLLLRPGDLNKASNSSLKFQGGYGEKPYQMVQVRGTEGVEWNFTELKDKNGKNIPKEAIEAFELIPQYISPDLNHETYLVAGKYLKKITKAKVDIESGVSKYIYLSINIRPGTEPGLYSGKISLRSGKVREEYPVEVKVLDYSLPVIDFPVGFFGPDPINYSYFNDPKLEKIRKDFRHEAIRILGESGFTTFSGLPEVKLIVEGDSWRLDTTLIDQAMTAANRAGMSKVYFSYGGKFPQQFLDGSLIPNGVTEDQFFSKVSPLLSSYLNGPGMPVIVHTFSDEAGGYSDKISEDISLAKKLRTKFPFLDLGGFSSLSDSLTRELRSYFKYGFYSNVTKNQIGGVSKSQKWGSYNASPGNLDDPRFTFGPGLYYSRSRGLSHYLEWHSSSSNNFPYYDMDGRESDVTMFMPTSDGKLNPTLRFALAVEGLSTFRKLMVLEEAIAKQAVPSGQGLSATKFMQAVKAGSWSSSENILRPNSSFVFKDFANQLDGHLESLHSIRH